MSQVRPPLVADLAWLGEMRFRVRTGENQMLVDGDSVAGPSPVQALAFALASCMASDVVHILGKQRQELKNLTAHLIGWRADEEPRRLTRIDLKFRLSGDIASDKIERALALSREKYCSVWHSLRPEIDFTVAYDLATPSDG